MNTNNTRSRREYGELEDAFRTALFAIGVPLQAIHMPRSAEPNKLARAAFDVVATLPDGKSVALVEYKTTEELKDVLLGIENAKAAMIIWTGLNPERLNMVATDADWAKAFPVEGDAAPAPTPVAKPANDAAKTARDPNDRWARAAETRKRNTLARQEAERKAREAAERKARREASQATRGGAETRIAARRGSRTPTEAISPLARVAAGGNAGRGQGRVMSGSGLIQAASRRK